MSLSDLFYDAEFERDMNQALKEAIYRQRTDQSRVGLFCLADQDR